MQRPLIENDPSILVQHIEMNAPVSGERQESKTVVFQTKTQDQAVIVTEKVDMDEVNGYDSSKLRCDFSVR